MPIPPLRCYRRIRLSHLLISDKCAPGATLAPDLEGPEAVPRPGDQSLSESRQGRPAQILHARAGTPRETNRWTPRAQVQPREGSRTCLSPSLRIAASPQRLKGTATLSARGPQSRAEHHGSPSIALSRIVLPYTPQRPRT